MFLSRLSLSTSPDVAALGALLNPGHDGRRMDAHHRLIWACFAGDPDARRSFLWREMGAGAFMVLSQTPPQETPLFDRCEAKAFAPALAAGDRLSVLLRANATRTLDAGGTRASGKPRTRHVDVVMEALQDVPRADRAALRPEAAEAAGARWLAGQGARAGFAVDRVAVQGYRVVDPPGRGPRRPHFGVLDLEGEITLTDPAAFLARLAQGFGRAKAFGCGLMLIRRA
jgi:CRISPR system Cascade subunit CasE